MRPLVWFRSDLRVADNPALHAAARASSRGIVGVYMLCREQWDRHDVAPVQRDFILRNVAALSAALAECNIGLRVLEAPTFDDVPAALIALARELECDAIHFNREYEVNERRRDEAVTEAAGEAGLTVAPFHDQCLCPPGELLTGTGGYYSVFTPFRRRWTRTIDEGTVRSEPLGMPRRPDAMVSARDPVPASDVAETIARPDLWPAGEQEAHRRLADFVKQRITSYSDNRDRPAVPGTSELSPYLARGVVSLRQCLHVARDANDGRLVEGCPGIDTWISELAWREFYKHILVGFPRVSMHRPFKLATDRIRWSSNDEHLAAWSAGRTGYPLVDAAMRQLRTTGWMHNRLRMVVAMFFTKNLFLDWRVGERFFMQHLVDGDLSANNGGWQWSASTGTDAAPYFRVFNPISQSQKCDPDGSFIRRYVPELAGVDGKAIHDPPPMARAAADYPVLIVDHKETRASAIAAFKALDTG